MFLPPITFSPSKGLPTPSRGQKRMKMFSHFPYLSDDLVFGILFSGYLGFSYADLAQYLIISKRILCIGAKCIGLLEMYGERAARFLQILVESRGISSVVFLKIGFSSTNFSEEMVTNILSWRKSLKGLSFRGSMIEDAHALQLLDSPDGADSEKENEDGIPQPRATQSFPNLVSLDLSKDSKSKSHLITDAGLLGLRLHPQLLWLSLSYTSISDDSIALIAQSLRQLQHLSLQGCYGVTNASACYLKGMSLLRLDITNCPLLGTDFFRECFGNKKEALFHSLEMLSCSFLTSFTKIDFYLIVACPKLFALECRSRLQRQGLITASEVLELRKKFNMLIIDHKDQIEFLKKTLTMLPTEPNYFALWPFYGWPYQSTSRVL